MKRARKVDPSAYWRWEVVRVDSSDIVGAGRLPSGCTAAVVRQTAEKGLKPGRYLLRATQPDGRLRTTSLVVR